MIAGYNESKLDLIIDSIEQLRVSSELDSIFESSFDKDFEDFCFATISSGFSINVCLEDLDIHPLYFKEYAKTDKGLSLVRGLKQKKIFRRKEIINNFNKGNLVTEHKYHAYIQDMGLFQKDVFVWGTVCDSKFKAMNAEVFSVAFTRYNVWNLRDVAASMCLSITELSALRSVYPIINQYFELHDVFYTVAKDTKKIR
jgi:hypothetical protein